MKRAVKPTEAAPPAGFYSPGVIAGPMIFVSGQLPKDADGRVVGTSAGDQTRKALENVEEILEAAGATLDHLASVTIYVSDIALWPEVNEAYRDYLSELEIPPARAIVPTGELHYGVHVEIAAIAYFPG